MLRYFCAASSHKFQRIYLQRRYCASFDHKSKFWRDENKFESVFIIFHRLVRTTLYTYHSINKPKLWNLQVHLHTNLKLLSKHTTSQLNPQVFLCLYLVGSSRIRMVVVLYLYVLYQARSNKYSYLIVTKE